MNSSLSFIVNLIKLLYKGVDISTVYLNKMKVDI